jgi:hypothetical protein
MKLSKIMRNFPVRIADDDLVTHRTSLLTLLHFLHFVTDDGLTVLLVAIQIFPLSMATHRFCGHPWANVGIA